MNNYTITQCPYCKEPGGFDSTETISVHGAGNVEVANRLLKAGADFDKVKRHFCTKCGEYTDDLDGPCKWCDR